MVAQLNAPADELTRVLVIDRVQAKIEAGMTPPEAFAAVFEEIEQEGRIVDLARLHGAKLVADLWRAWNIDHRPAAISKRIAVPVHPTDITQTQNTQSSSSPTPYPRVVDVGLLRERATLDSQYKINGSWIVLRNMGAHDCMEVFKQYRGVALSKEHNARLFRAIAQQLGEGETVGQRFTNADLVRLYKIARPAGNTLA